MSMLQVKLTHSGMHQPVMNYASFISSENRIYSNGIPTYPVLMVIDFDDGFRSHFFKKRIASD